MDLAGLRAYAKTLEPMDDVALAQDTAGWRPGTAEHHVCLAEISKRAKSGDRRIAWFAVAVSLVGLVVSIVALVTHRG